MSGTRARVLYLADIRFPIERANGIQTIETCHALARAGFDVHLLVRHDTQTPARDPLTYYGLPPIDRLAITRLALSGSPAMRRWRYLAAAVRHACSGRADVVFTRDLLLASLLLGLPRRLVRHSSTSRMA